MALSEQDKIMCDIIGRYTEEVAEKASYEDIQKAIIECLDNQNNLIHCAFKLYELAVRNGCYMKSSLYTEIISDYHTMIDVIVLLWDSVYAVIVEAEEAEEGERNR